MVATAGAPALSQEQLDALLGETSERPSYSYSTSALLRCPASGFDLKVVGGEALPQPEGLAGGMRVFASPPSQKSGNGKSNGKKPSSSKARAKAKRLR